MSQPHNLGLIYGLLRWNRVVKPVLLNTINPIFANIFFAPKGGQVSFLVKILIPRTDFLKIFNPCLGFIYIDTLIFTWSIILSVKIELSLRLTWHYSAMQLRSFPLYTVGISLSLLNKDLPHKPLTSWWCSQCPPSSAARCTYWGRWPSPCVVVYTHSYDCSTLSWRSH